MARRSRHTKEELQALIVEATLGLVQNHGPAHVTARRIAEAIGYTPGMLYAAFTNLQEILLHVNAASLEMLHADCAAACKGAEGAEASIRAMGLAYLAFAEQRTHQFDLLFQRAEFAELDVPPALGQRIRSLFSLIEEELASLDPGADDRQLQVGARALWSGVHGTAALALSNQLYLDRDHADREIVEALITRFVGSWRQAE